LIRREAERLVADAVESGRLERGPAVRLADGLADGSVREAVLEGAFESKRRGKGELVSVARNVFIPLTNLCRDRCAYCTFAKLPDSPEAHTYTLAEVEEAVSGGVRSGCTEALFCLGDKPEIAYRSHREWLGRRGFETTAAYLVDGCRVAFEGGLLPHTNAGILTAAEMTALRRWNASMGLMLESSSPRLRERGMPHYYAPDKDPARRIRMHEEAGELRIPFTSGILLGIGETAGERVETLLAIRSLADRYGHVQETIVQPFHPKPGTPMRAAEALSDVEVAGWVALARLVLGPEMNVQAPPNLAPDVLELLLRSGLNDWGGVSPVTVDFINPEAPWPTFRELRRRTEAAGQRLVERLPVYPELLLRRPEFFDVRVREAALGRVDETGYVRPHGDGAKVEAA
jgi:7,8-didemethyl-8-hydroxy-5-deazariboflavin synthase CofG subunit